MHFRTHSTKPVALPSKPTDLARKTPPSQVSTLEVSSDVDANGIACWDYAYNTGRANEMRLASTECPSMMLLPGHHRFIPACSILQAAAQQGVCVGLLNNSSQSSKFDTKTYLLSAPTPESILNPYTDDTIRTLLAQSQTKLILLVPQCSIVCPKVCEFMRLNHATGSSIQVIPVEPEVTMTYTPRYHMDNDDQHIVSAKDDANVAQVVKKILKVTKINAFDAYIAFEEEREAWCFLDVVGKGVREGREAKEKPKRR
jgi:hypothetical protein